ncbi:DUF6216 family protein [Caballeronia sp. Lep1P3]|uniref:DUF6216 family protein n=1 Tax=Caballeronia sp. Lep1P3 TaxID=2878150 RepID=UPI00351D834F
MKSSTSYAGYFVAFLIAAILMAGAIRFAASANTFVTFKKTGTWISVNKSYAKRTFDSEAAPVSKDSCREGKSNVQAANSAWGALAIAGRDALRPDSPHAVSAFVCGPRDGRPLRAAHLARSGVAHDGSRASVISSMHCFPRTGSKPRR